MDETSKEELVRQFRGCLEQLPEEALGTISTDGCTDLYTLFAALTALKNEVKIESRQVKAALEEFKTVFAILQEAQEQMATELTSSRNDRDTLCRAQLRPLLKDLLELHDRLTAGQVAGTRYRPSFFARICKRDVQMLEGLQNGQQMTLRRLEALLASCRVRPLEVLGRSFDPACMHAAATENRPELADGVVTVELRKGFLWDKELLRIPEVKINKIIKDMA